MAGYIGLPVETTYRSSPSRMRSGPKMDYPIGAIEFAEYNFDDSEESSAAGRRMMTRCRWSLVTARHIVTKFIISVVSITSILSVGLGVSAHAASADASLTAVGNFVTTGNNGITTSNANLSKAGDLLVIWVKSRFTTNPQIHITTISASGTGAIGVPVNAIQYYTLDHPGNDDEIWYAPVTTAGTITLTFTW